MRNELDNETSPYLLQHADNPVHWQAWGSAALETARRNDKPILLSIGYAACHWCHVMAHESFEDDDTAEVMNRHFVPIKVDREERPDLDAVYQNALQLLGEHGGWPLTMFLTPDGTPFWGGTYFPPEPKFGRPGFRTLLERVAEVYTNEGEKVAQNANAMREALARMGHSAAGELIPLDIADKVAERLLPEFDSANGGIGMAPKFPHVTIFELVLRAGLRTGNAQLVEAVVFSLRKMSQGGIYDHLGGGFARYATDPRWLVPHFEKMLYDNAQLLDILRLVHNLTGDPLFAERITETADWVLREMVADGAPSAPSPDSGGSAAGGGFAATLDADSEGEEGRFYVWSEAEVDEVLGAGEDADLFKSIYDVSGDGNWEGRNILNRIDHPERLDEAGEARLADARAKLLARRAGRVRPGWDDKVLADWNGLMIAAMARAGAAFGREGWIKGAVAAFDFVRNTMTIDGTDRLVHSYRAGKPGGTATLDDYAAMTNAALVLYEVLGEPRFMEAARAWIDVAEAHYADPQGGYFLTADDADDMIVRPKNAFDGSIPSGNGMMAAALARLYALSADDADRERAERVIRAFSGELERNVFPLATLINAADLLSRAAQVVIVGDRSDETTRAMVRAAHQAAQPNLVLQVAAPDALLPNTHPAHGKTQKDGKPTAYLCVGPTCSLPLTDPDALRDAVTRA